MPDPAEDARIQPMLLSMPTQRPDEPAPEQSPLDQARAGVAADMMSSSYWNGEPMYYEPAASLNYTDEAVRNVYLERLAHDAEHRAAERPRARDEIFRDAWEQGKRED